MNLLKARRGHLVPVRVVYSKKGIPVMTTVWKKPIDKDKGQLQLKLGFKVKGKMVQFHEGTIKQAMGEVRKLDKKIDGVNVEMDKFINQKEAIGFGNTRHIDDKLDAYAKLRDKFSAQRENYKKIIMSSETMQDVWAKYEHELNRNLKFEGDES